MYAMYAYIDPQTHPNVGKYTSPMECLGRRPPDRFGTVKSVHVLNTVSIWEGVLNLEDPGVFDPLVCY